MTTNEKIIHNKYLDVNDEFYTAPESSGQCSPGHINDRKTCPLLKSFERPLQTGYVRNNNTNLCILINDSCWQPQCNYASFTVKASCHCRKIISNNSDGVVTLGVMKSQFFSARFVKLFRQTELVKNVFFF